MKSIQKIALIGGVLVTSSALLFSFNKSNGEGEKMKKYQIIHHSNGKTTTYDTVVPMRSSFTPEQFVASKGISTKNIEIIKIPALSELEAERKMIKTLVREIDIEKDGNGKQEEVEIKVEIDDDGTVKTQKIVNGVEVEMTEDEIQDIKTKHGKHGKVIEMHIDDAKDGKKEERVEISVEIDDAGNVVTKKIVNGEEVEMTEQELENLHVFEMKDAEDIRVFIDNESLENELKELELEIEQLMGEESEHEQVIVKRIDLHSGEEDDFNWISEDGEQHVVMMSSDNEDHTLVLVTENYDENASAKTKIMMEESNSNTNIFPNPNDGTFRIRYQSDEAVKTKVTVTDANGKKVFEDNLGKFSGTYDKEVDLKKFGTGMYTVTIEGGNTKEVQKVMIQ